jgi:hypothetical protein
VDGVWLDEFCDELAIFPQGSNDDQVDVTSYAARVQSHEWTPAKTPERPGRHQWDDVVTRAGVSATGNGALDLSRVQY